MNGAQEFNRTIRQSLIDNTAFLKGRLDYIPRFTKIARKLRQQEKVRTSLLESQDLSVPSILIISVTNDCNLSCHGCYACAQDRDTSEEMTTDQIHRIVGEAVETGVGIIFLAGGEPLLKEDILKLPETYTDTLFVLFTNGTLFHEKTIERIKRAKNLVPAFSLEGNDETTNQRRGEGVFSEIKAPMHELEARKMLFGESITLTKENYREVMDHRFLKGLEDDGCRTLFLIEYVPCEGDPQRCLTEEQKADLIRQVRDFPNRYSMLPIALPGDESKYDGCLAAGRGFLHVGSDGALEACPFAPFSDVNLKERSFKEALSSRMLRKIREQHDQLEEALGGCTLFENREWVMNLMDSTDNLS